MYTFKKSLLWQSSNFLDENRNGSEDINTDNLSRVAKVDSYHLVHRRAFVFLCNQLTVREDSNLNDEDYIGWSRKKKSVKYTYTKNTRIDKT